MFPETALVTGAASGIGRALVELLERGGTRVLGLDLRDGFDVGDPMAWEAVGPVDLACLNAGTFTKTTDVRELPDGAYRRVLAANVDGVVFGVRRLSKVMSSGSAIVVTASLAGLTTIEMDPVYGGSKHFVVGFVRSVAPQLSELGLTINAVCPAAVDTPMIESARERILASGTQLLRPDEVAEAVLLAGRSGDTGQAWVCIPGRAPARHEFPSFFETS